MAGLTPRLQPWICCYSSHRNSSWHGGLAGRKMQTLESLVCGLGWETWAGRVPQSRVRASRDGSVGTGGTGLPSQGPACPGALGLPSLPPSCSLLSPGGANPIRLLENGAVFSGLGSREVISDVLSTGHWAQGQFWQPVTLQKPQSLL